MKSGRELDAMIAEKVMGWHRVDTADGQREAYLAGKVWYREHAPRARRGYGTIDYITTNSRPSLPSQSRLWSPSSDIAAAWEVHIAMCDRPFSVRRRYYEAMQQHATFHTDLGHRHTAAWPDVLTVLRNRFPEVICLAALEAVGASSEATNG